MQTTAPLIEAHQITQKFGDTTVLKEISLTLHPKEIVTLIGPNGAGKSTLLKILLGLIEPTAGQVIRKPGLRIGFMPQKIQIDATLPMSVERFLKLGLRPPSLKTEAEPIAPAPFFKGLKNRLSTVFKTVFSASVMIPQPSIKSLKNSISKHSYNSLFRRSRVARCNVFCWRAH